jgi:hypothetical protein
VDTKDSQGATLELVQRFRALSPEEKQVVQRLLIEDLLTGDESQRFDALAIITEFDLAGAQGALEGLADRLGRESAPGAAYELQKVNRTIARLGHAAAP